MKIKDEVEDLWRDVNRLSEEIYNPNPSIGIKSNLTQMTNRQNRLERKLDMLMDYLGVEEKHEPEKHYIDRKYKRSFNGRR